MGFLTELSALILTWPLDLHLDPELTCPRAYVIQVLKHSFKQVMETAGVHCRMACLKMSSSLNASKETCAWTQT